MQQASLCGLHYFPNPDIVTLAHIKAEQHSYS